jgi:hypothetical protein
MLRSLGSAYPLGERQYSNGCLLSFLSEMLRAKMLKIMRA